MHTLHCSSSSCGYGIAGNLVSTSTCVSR
jgi:hypothetical protein